MGVGSHHKQITEKFAGTGKQPCSNHAINRPELCLFRVYVVRGEIALKLCCAWSTPLIFLGPEDTPSFCAVEPRQCDRHGRGRFGRAVPTKTYAGAD